MNSDSRFVLRPFKKAPLEQSEHSILKLTSSVVRDFHFGHCRALQSDEFCDMPTQNKCMFVLFHSVEESVDVVAVQEYYSDKLVQVFDQMDM